jgi:hypothetical protein
MGTAEATDIFHSEKKIGWGGRIRTFTVLINSEVSYRLDHAPAATRALRRMFREKTHPDPAKRRGFAASGATKGSPKITRAKCPINFGSEIMDG